MGPLIQQKMPGILTLTYNPMLGICVFKLLAQLVYFKLQNLDIGRDFVWLTIGRTIPSFLRNHHVDFQSDCSSLHSHPQWRSAPLALHPFHYLPSLEFFILTIRMGVSWNLRVV